MAVVCYLDGHGGAFSLPVRDGGTRKTFLPLSEWSNSVEARMSLRNRFAFKPAGSAALWSSKWP